MTMTRIVLDSIVASAARGGAALQSRASCFLFVLALLHAVLPDGVAAQAVQGRVSDATSGAPVSVALVVLLDSAGVQRGGDLTDSDGTFRVQVPGPGRYTLQAERIGFETVVHAFEVMDNRIVTLDLSAAPLALDLAGVRVEVRRQCSTSAEEGQVIATLWEETRKALRNQQWTTRMGLARFRLVEYERELHPSSHVAIGESRRSFRHTGQNPIRSRPADELHTKGFVRSLDTGEFAYYGPDAAVLLSDEFVEAHCFGLTSSPDDPELIGITFRPRPDRRAARDIEGTLWLTREGARLNSVEFTYTWSPWVEARGVAGGRVDFEELPNGAWIVRNWWIRMPRMVENLGLMSGGRSGLRVAGIVEVGGSAEQVDVLRVAGVADGATGRVRGQVWDSVRARPLAGAEIYIQDDAPTSVTDGSGRFILDDVPIGVHDVLFRHPRLDSLALTAPAARVSVTRGGEAEVVLGVPSLRTLIGVLCVAADMPAGVTVVSGTVTAPDSDRPVSGATVALEWTDIEVVAGREFQADVQMIEVTTDTRGRYVACGVPPGVQLAARASHDDTEGAIERAVVPARDLLVMNLGLTPPAAPDVTSPPAPCASSDRAMGSIVGRVREASTNVPIGPSEVWLVSADRDVASTRSDAAGRFAFCDLPAGEYVVRTAIRGLGSALASFDVAAGDAAEVDLRVAPESTGAQDAILRGRVVRADDGQPLAGAEVRLGNGSTQVSTADGSFTFDELMAGQYAVTASYLGYADSEGEIIVSAGQDLAVQIQMNVQAVEIDPILVESVRFGRGLLADVQRRARSGFGTVVMGQELESRLSSVGLTDLLREHGATVGSNGSTLMFRRTGCAPQVYIDGVRMTHVPRTAGPPGSGEESPGADAARALNLVSTADIAAVEIYQGPAQTPGEFLDSNAGCGVIIVWTQRGDG